MANIIAFQGASPPPVGAAPAIPAGSVFLLDASQPATINGGAPVDGALVTSAGTFAQAVMADQPTYDTISGMGGPGILLGGAAQQQPPVASPTWLTQAAVPFAVPFTVVCAAIVDGSFVVFEISTNAQAAQGALLSSNLNSTMLVHGPSGIQQIDALGPAWNTDNLPRYFKVSCDGTTTSLIESLAAVQRIIPLQLGGVAPGSGAITMPMTLGADHAGGNALVGVLMFAAGWPRALTDLEWANLRAYLTARWPVPDLAPKSRNVIAIGDSMTAAWFASTTNATGTSPDPSRAYSQINTVCSWLGSRFGQVTNIGVGGALLVPFMGFPILSVLEQWNTIGKLAVVDGMPNIVSVQGGVNDYNSGRGGTAPADMATVVSQVVSDLAPHPSDGVHPHLVVAHQLPWEFGYSTPADFTAFNSAAVANLPALGNASVTVRGVLVGGDAILGNQVRPTAANVWFHDATHCNKTGHRRWAKYVLDQILAQGL